METATLANFKQKFNTPLPAWFKEIEEESNRRIVEAPFADICRKGNKEAMKRLMVNLWPFVEIFPRLVRNGYMRLLHPTMYLQYGIINMISLSYHSMMFLSSIERDEKSHRELWINSSSALGLSYPQDFGQSVTPETHAWIDSVATKINPADMFLAFVAIEFIAESVSKNFIQYDPFKNAFGAAKSGLGWFTVHTIDHGEISHANLELHLSLAFRKDLEDSAKQNARSIILGVVDKFLSAANACV
ncbi:MAG: hypothetical protein G01um101470_1026 [Parcubacteria group bacterium Gr01-1014_70]|nr:MAG: hypothetical protein G01um101470_1026 [Parcubacteria group bacterium Gr01-1014_70]